jgi:hypothetical protein
MTIIIDAVSIPDGKHATIELTKTGDRSGLITVDGQSFNLTNIRTSSDGLGLTCDGPLGATVTCSIHASTPQSNPFISVEIRSFFFHSTKNYQITPEDQQRLVEFVRQSFPPAIS